MARREFTQAAEAFAKGEMAQAAEFLTEEVINDTENPPTSDHMRLVKAVALLKAGKASESVQTLSKISAAHQRTLAVMRVTAAASLAKGDLATAEKAVLFLIQNKVEGATVWRQIVQVRQGLAFLAARDYKQALQRLRTADVSTSSPPDLAKAVVAGCLFAALALGEFAEGESVLSSYPALSRDPDTSILAAKLAMARLDVPGAVARIKALGAPGAGAPGAGDALFWNFLRRLFAAGKYEDVVSVYPEVCSRPEPLCRMAALLTGLSLRQLNRRPEAQSILERLLSSKPEDRGLLHFSALLALESGDLTAAETLSARLPKEYRQALLLRWGITFARGKYAAVKTGLTPEMIRGIPEGPERTVASLMAAFSNAMLGATNRARLLLKEKKPSLNLAHRCLFGYASLAEGQFEDAAQNLSGTPLGPLARLEHARHRADQGDPMGALEELGVVAREASLAGSLAETRHHIFLQAAFAAIKKKDLATSARHISAIKRAGADFAPQAAVLEDFLRFCMGLSDLPTQGWEERSAFFASFLAQVPAGAPERHLMSRGAELTFLKAAAQLRQIREKHGKKKAEPIDLSTPREILDAALGFDPGYAPAAAILGLILHTSNDERAFTLLDLAQRQGLTSPAIQLALAMRYVYAGRLLEAKKIFLNRVEADPEHVPTIRQLKEILEQESMALLKVAQVRERPVIEIPDLPESIPEIDPFAGTDPRQRVFVLLSHAERNANENAKWLEVSRKLKWLAVKGDFSTLGEVEKAALALLSGAAATALVSSGLANWDLAAPVLFFGALFQWGGGGKPGQPLVIEKFGNETVLSKMVEFSFQVPQPFPGTDLPAMSENEAESLAEPFLKVPLLDFGALLGRLPPIPARKWPVFDSSRPRHLAVLGETNFLELASVDPKGVLEDAERLLESPSKAQERGSVHG